MRKLTPAEAAFILTSPLSSPEQRRRASHYLASASLFHPWKTKIPVEHVVTFTLTFSPREKKTTI